MGQFCSAQIHISKDPLDQSLEPVHLHTTDCIELDQVFEKASKELNELLDLHNALVHAEEEVKEAACIVNGVPHVILREVSNGPEKKIEMLLASKNTTEPIDKDLLTRDVGLHYAYQTATTCLEELNKKLHQEGHQKEPKTEWSLQNGRVQSISSCHADVQIEDFNHAIFKLRKELFVTANAMKIPQVIKYFLKEIHRVHPEIQDPNIEISLEDACLIISDFEWTKDHRWGQRADLLREKLNQLLKANQKVLDHVPEIRHQLTETRKEALEKCSQWSSDDTKVSETVEKNIHDLDTVMTLTTCSTLMAHKIIRVMDQALHHETSPSLAA